MTRIGDGGGEAAPAWTVRSIAMAPLHALRRFRDDDCGQHAAAIAYYALLSFFPFVLLLASVASVLVGGSAEDVRSTLESLRPLLPSLDETSWGAIDQFVQGRSVYSLASLLLLTWLASRVTSSTQVAVLAVFHSHAAPVRRGVLRALRAWVLTVAMLVALGVAFVAVGIFEYVVRASPDDLVGREVLRSASVTRHVVPFLVAAGVGVVVYATLPRRRVATRNVILGALFFAAFHALATRLFTAGTALASERDAVYGSFVGVVSFMAWFYIASCLLLLGAELVAVIDGVTRGVPRSP